MRVKTTVLFYQQKDSYKRKWVCFAKGESESYFKNQYLTTGLEYFIHCIEKRRVLSIEQIHEKDSYISNASKTKLREISMAF